MVSTFPSSFLTAFGKASVKLQVRHTLETEKRFFVFFFSNSKLLHNEQLQDYLRKSKKQFS